MNERKLRSLVAKPNKHHLYSEFLIAPQMNPWGMAGQNSVISLGSVISKNEMESSSSIPESLLTYFVILFLLNSEVFSHCVHCIWKQNSSIFSCNISFICIRYVLNWEKNKLERRHYPTLCWLVDRYEIKDYSIKKNS